MDIIIIIPAHLASVRLGRKMLIDIDGLPMIEHVRRRAFLSEVFDDVIVVTNSNIIKRKLKKYNAKVKLTKKRHLSGTSRVSEITKYFKFDYACILFADEPFINPDKLSLSIKKVIINKKIKAFNLITNLKSNDMNSNQVVKTVIDTNQNITNYFRNFSSKFKGEKIRKSSGILIFKKNLIDKYNQLKLGINEKKFKIEQFRLLENNVKIKSIFIKNIYPSINTKKEFKFLISLLRKDKKEIKFLNKVKRFEN